MKTQKIQSTIRSIRGTPHIIELLSNPCSYTPTDISSTPGDFSCLGYDTFDIQTEEIKNRFQSSIEHYCRVHKESSPRLISALEFKLQARINRAQAIKRRKSRQVNQESSNSIGPKSIQSSERKIKTQTKINTARSIGLLQSLDIENEHLDTSEYINENMRQEKGEPAKKSTGNAEITKVGKKMKKTRTRTKFGKRAKKSMKQKRIKRGVRVLKTFYDENRGDLIFKLERDGRVTEEKRFDLVQTDPKVVLYFYERHLEFNKITDFNPAILDKL